MNGIGNGPDGSEKLGKCSQIACFIRKDIANESVVVATEVQEASDNDLPSNQTEPLYETIYNYQMIKEYQFPFNIELRTPNEIILDEVKYYFDRYLYLYDDYFDYETNLYEFPLNDVYVAIKEAPDINELRDIIRENFSITADDIIRMSPPEDDQSTCSEEYCDYNQNEQNDNENNQAVGGATQEALEEEEFW